MITTPIKIRTLQRKLYQVSKQKEVFRFYSLYDKVYRRDVLEEAYKRNKSNKGAPGVDGISFETIEKKGRKEFLDDIQEELRSKTYKPLPIKRVLIPKGKNKTRPLGISSIRDRVVQTACKMILEPIFEPQLYEHSYGYRPMKRAQTAVKQIEIKIKDGYHFVYDADLSGYFDSIPHKEMLSKMGRKISDGNILNLLKSYMQAEIYEETKKGKFKKSKSKIGVPQGNILSPLMANIFLNDFCLKIAEKTPCEIVSYADDFVILHNNPFTEIQLKWFKEELRKEGLTVNEEKTKVVDIYAHGANFDFLGFSFKFVKSFYSGNRYLNIQPSKKSQLKFKEAIGGIVKHRTSLTLKQLIGKINPIIRGWKNYFKEAGYPRTVFFKLDWFISARFYRWSRRLSQRGSKRFAQNTWKILKANGLVYLQPIRSKSL